MACALHDKFIEEYGTIICRDIHCKIFGRIFNLWDPEDKKAFEEFYKIKLGDGDDAEEIINKIAEKKSYLLKGGRFDEHRTFMEVVRDWQQGRLGL